MRIVKIFKGHEVTITDRGASSKSFKNVTCEMHIEKQSKGKEIKYSEILAIRYGKTFFHNNKKDYKPERREMKLTGVYAEIADLYGF